jgi:hypothetical protein
MSSAQMGHWSEEMLDETIAVDCFGTNQKWGC